MLFPFILIFPPFAVCLATSSAQPTFCSLQSAAAVCPAPCCCLQIEELSFQCQEKIPLICSLLGLVMVRKWKQGGSKQIHSLWREWGSVGEWETRGGKYGPSKCCLLLSVTEKWPYICSITLTIEGENYYFVSLSPVTVLTGYLASWQKKASLRWIILKSGWGEEQAHVCSYTRLIPAAFCSDEVAERCTHLAEKCSGREKCSLHSHHLSFGSLCMPALCFCWTCPQFWSMAEAGGDCLYQLFLGCSQVGMPPRGALLCE